MLRTVIQGISRIWMVEKRESEKRREDFSGKLMSWTVVDRCMRERIEKWMCAFCGRYSGSLTEGNVRKCQKSERKKVGMMK